MFLSTRAPAGGGRVRPRCAPGRLPGAQNYTLFQYILRFSRRPRRDRSLRIHGFPIRFRRVPGRRGCPGPAPVRPRAAPGCSEPYIFLYVFMLFPRTGRGRGLKKSQNP